MIEPEIAAALQGYLLPGERLTWTGRPPAGVRLTGKDALFIPFSLVWGGFALFWEAMVLSQALTNPEVPWIFPLFGVPFVVIGLYLIAGRFWADAWLRSRTLYALTDRRALVLRTAFGARLTSSPLSGPVRLARQSGARGTLEFGAPNPLAAMGGAFWPPGFTYFTGATAFEDIPDVMQVYALATAT